MAMGNDDAIVRALIADCNRELRDNVQIAIRKLIELAKDDSIDPKHQLKAIDMILVRVMGKPPDKIEIKSGAPWEAAIASALVASDADVIDAEIIEESHADLAGQTAIKKKKKIKKKRKVSE
jgi:hypothetical protein